MTVANFQISTVRKSFQLLEVAPFLAKTYKLLPKNLTFYAYYLKHREMIRFSYRL